MYSNKKLAKFIKNEYIFSVILKIVNIVLSVIQSILIARFLGAELKGNSTYISSITSTASVLITFGMHQVYPYFRKKHGKEAIYKDFISIVYALYVSYMIISILLALFVFDSKELKAATILTPIIGYGNVVSYITLIENPNRRNGLYIVICFLEATFVTLLYIFVTRSFFWMIAVLAFVQILTCIIYTISLHCIPHYHKGLIKLFAEIAKFGFFPMLALLMTTLNYRIDTLMLKSYGYISMAQIGVYSIGISIADKIVLIPDTLKGVLASKLSKNANEKDVARICRICFMASCFLCLCVLAFVEWVIEVFYGSEYNGAYSVVIVSAVGAIFIGYFKLIAQYNIIHRKQVQNFFILSIAIITNVIGNIAFVPMWGINGAALSTCISHFVCGIVFISYFCSKSNVKVSEMVFIQRSDMDLIKNLFRKTQR